MWPAAVATEAFRAAATGAVELRQEMLRLFGIPESEIAETLRLAEDAHGLEGLEITTCLRRGEIEIVTRFAPARGAALRALRARPSASATPTRSSPTTGARSTSRWPMLLRSRGRTVATAESCTGGLLAARLTELAGSSDYVLGGLVVYSNEAKAALAGVDPALIERVGAVSTEVAEALADGARARLGADVGVGITGRRRAGRRDRGQAGRASSASASTAADARSDAQREPPGRPGRRARPLDHRRHAPRPPAAAGASGAVRSAR